MLNITLTDEQVITLIEQLPHDKKEELLNHLLFEEWLNTPEALKLKEKRKEQFTDGKTFTLEEIRKRLNPHA